MTKVKVCGLSDPLHVLTAARAGVDFLGLVFAPSRRQVNQKRAREIIEALKAERGPIPGVVGVFVNAPIEEVNRVAEYCGLDWVQLNGDEPWEYCQKISKPLIKAIRIQEKKPLAEILDDLEKGNRLLGGNFIPLLDSWVEGSYGGTGHTLDWGQARSVAERIPAIIAGGLSPSNVAQAIRMVRPWGVDVSSGVETNGVKDGAKIKTFVDEVRKVDQGRH